VLWRGGVSLLRAHVSESPQRYNAFGPYLEKGGPPPRVAFVASVAAAVGYPASVNVAAACRRVRSASGSGNVIGTPSNCAQMRCYDGTF
jgi:hypothetical protein